MCRALVFTVLSVCVTVSVPQILPNPEVIVEQGTLRGKYETTVNGRSYAAFLGIPYAQPPVGKQRFKEPKPPKPWVGVFDATELGSECLQYSHLTYNTAGDEDCLFLNVYTPIVPTNVQSTRTLDVIVYIHEGAFMFLNGHGFGPRYLLDRDVVYVNLNYRLGIFGFLSTGDAVIPGNNGLKDQSAALRWVHKNIAAFGGNPASVTIAGVSAGGVSVHYHYLSPLSQGLFTRGISFSGTALCPWALMDNGRQKAIQLGSSLGCNTEDSTLLLNCLRSRPGKQIVAKTKQFLGWLYNPFSPFGPTVEAIGSKTPFITQEPYEILKSGQFQQLPWIATVTSEEGLYPGVEIVSSPNHLQDLATNWNAYLPHLLDFNHTVEPELRLDVCSDITNYYLQNKYVPKATAELIQMIGDRLFVSCAAEAAKIQAAASLVPVYFYYFTYNGVHNQYNMFTHNYGKQYGVSQGDDVVYILNSPYLYPMSAADKEMSERLIDFVTSYARNGIPRFTPNFAFPTVQEGLPDLKYVHVKSPSQFVAQQSPDLGHSEFWFSLPLYEAPNIARQEPLLVDEPTARAEL